MGINTLLDRVVFDQHGLVPAIAQQYDSGDILMMAWMTKQSLEKTLKTGDVWYYSRSRQKLWRKGEISGHVQKLISASLDCDGDSILLKIDQTGPACHTGRQSCFFQKLEHLSESE